jgi:DNA-binding transcriptional LysR family regulator
MFNQLFSRSGLSLERLRTFCEVAEVGSMAKAANGDTVKQSQFSRQIKELEEHFGQKLTERSGRNVVLTKAGSEFAAMARQVLATLEDFQQGGGNRTVEISLGAGESFHRGVILPRLGQIRSRLPEITLGLRNLRGVEIVEGLIDGRLDLGVIDEDELTGDLQSERLGKVAYGLVVRKDALTTTERKGANWKAALALPFVGMEGRNRMMTAITELAKEAKVDIRFSVKCSSWLAVADVLAQQGGVGVLPSVIPVPAGCVAINVPGLRPFDRNILLAWDARRGTIRPQSAKSQRVLADVLKF